MVFLRGISLDVIDSRVVRNSLQDLNLFIYFRGGGGGTPLRGQRSGIRGQEVPESVVLVHALIVRQKMVIICNRKGRICVCAGAAVKQSILHRKAFPDDSTILQRRQ